MADLSQILSVFGAIVLIGIVFGFAVLGFYLWISKKQYEIAYVDKYKQFIQVSKMNCPNELYEKKLLKAPDKNFSGIGLGYIYGKNWMEFNKKWYHVFIICRQKKKFYNPLSWGLNDQIAVAEKEKIVTGDGYNIKWLVGGLDYEGFFIFEAGGDLTPNDIFEKTKSMVGLKQANLMLRKMSELVEEATEANPNVKVAQKIMTEIPSKER